MAIKWWLYIHNKKVQPQIQNSTKIQPQIQPNSKFTSKKQWEAESFTGCTRRDFLWIRKILFQCRKKKAVSQTRHFLWSGKITYEESFQRLLKSCLLFAGSLESLMQKKGETTEEEGGGFWKSRGIFHAWGSYGNCWIHFGEYWKTTEMHSLCAG